MFLWTLSLNFSIQSFVGFCFQEAKPIFLLINPLPAEIQANLYENVLKEEVTIKLDIKLDFLFPNKIHVRMSI
jgi:hypothetical protein